uniref:Chromosome 2 open reading frame 78 n=1 Tax=Neovison vison TaxID=452646 RepID=A0A8C7A1N4_NEOVI
QLSLPVVTNAASLTGNVCNFSRVSAPAVSSAWLLPSVSGASFQPLMGSTTLGMEASLGLQPPSQTYCLPQTPEFPKSCSSRNIQILESNPPPELGDISMIAPVQSSKNVLALPPAPSQEQTENKNLDDIKTKLSKPLDVYQIPIENQDPPLLPLEIPDIHQLLACIDPLGQEEKPVSENTNLGKNALGLEDQVTLENGIESSSGFADIATLVEDIHLPQFFNSLKDLDDVQEKSSAIKAPSDHVRKNKHKATEPINDAPKTKIQAKNPECLLGEEVIICNVADGDRAPVNRAKHPNSKSQKAASSRTSKTKSHGQEKTKRTRENNPKKAEESKQSGNKVKAEEKPTIPKGKRKKNQPELSQESFKKPRSCLGMHMLESVSREKSAGGVPPL